MTDIILLIIVGALLFLIVDLNIRVKQLEIYKEASFSSINILQDDFLERLKTKKEYLEGLKRAEINRNTKEKIRGN